MVDGWLLEEVGAVWWRLTASPRTTRLWDLSRTDVGAWLSAYVSHALSCEEWVLTGGAAAAAAVVHWQSIIDNTSMYSHTLSDIHRHTLALTLTLTPRYQFSSLGRRSFAVAGPTTWNSLSTDLRDPMCLSDVHQKLFCLLITSVSSALEVFLWRCA